MTLTQSELETFKQRLYELRQHLTRSLEGSAKEVKKPDESKGYSQHQADEGTDDFDKRISLELTSKEFDILRQIERALEKIDDKTYGICDVTGKPIPTKRLEAIPYANMTVEAQDLFEKGLL